MRRIWAVAKHMIAEGVRKKIAISLLVVLVLVLPLLPFVASGDGTLRGRVQASMMYMLWVVSLILSLLTIFIACGSLTGEITSKQIHHIVTKPIPRWQFLFGKWLGIAVLDGVLLLVCGLLMYGMVRLYLQNGTEGHAGDRDRLLHEVLTARHARSPIDPTDRINKAVKAEFEDMRERGNLPDPDKMSAAQVMNEIRVRKEREEITIPPLMAKRYQFDGLEFVDRSADQKIYIRFQVRVGRVPPNEVLHSFWIVGDPVEGGTAYPFDRTDRPDLPHEIEVPADAVTPEGTLTVLFNNINRVSNDPDAIINATFPTTVTFEGDDALQVLYRVGSFEGNLSRTLGMMYCRLIFLAGLGLFSATFLSFPVACMMSMMIFTTAAGASWFLDALDTTGIVGAELDPTGGALARFFRWLAWAFLKTIPNFSAYNAIPTLVDGRVVTLVWLLQAFGSMVVFKSAVIGALACVIFQRREIAEVII